MNVKDTVREKYEGIDVEAIATQVEGRFMSAFMRAVKPKECCGPACCS